MNIFYEKMGLLDITMYGIPVFRKKLFIADKYYLMPKEQPDGELDLINLAEKARREDHWTYFHRDSFWVHTVGDHHEEYCPKTGGVKMSMQSQPINLQNQDIIKYLGHAATEYHIHVDEAIRYYFKCNPENAKTIGQYREYVKSILIYPSKRDLINSMEIDDRTFKLATSLGITTYKLKSSELFEKKNLEQMMLDCQPPFADSDRPFEEWIDRYVNNVKEELGNYATLDFCHKQKL